MPKELAQRLFNQLHIRSNPDGFISKIVDREGPEQSGQMFEQLFADYGKLLAASDIEDVFRMDLWKNIFRVRRYDLIAPFLTHCGVTDGLAGNIINYGSLTDANVRAEVLKYAQDNEWGEDFFYGRGRWMGNGFLKDSQRYKDALLDFLTISPRLCSAHFLTVSLNMTQVLFFNPRETDADLVENMGLLADILIQRGVDLEDEILYDSAGNLPRYKGVLHFCVEESQKPIEPHRKALWDTLIEMMIEKGCQWRRVLDDTDIDSQTRQALLRQPWIRKTLLEEKAQTPNTSRVGAKPLKM